MKVTDSAKASSLEILPFKVDFSLPSVFIQGHFGFCDLSSGFLLKEGNASLVCHFSFNLDTMQYFHLNSLNLRELLTLHFLSLFLCVWGCLSAGSSEMWSSSM
jgi:hypothetical protein